MLRVKSKLNVRGSKSKVASNTSNPSNQPPALKVKAEPGVVIGKKTSNAPVAGASKALKKVSFIDLSDSKES
ncbi:hypothetical protein P8452_76227 [Trifolium repens]|nr:hypothetical protein P8452_76227 [Trifolium repens]